MSFSTPRFWYKQAGLLSALLGPASAIYNFARTHHQKGKAPYKASVPVICIGNLTVGGSGKTPTVQSLIHLLKEEGLAKTPCILSRGYGGCKDVHLVTEEDTHVDVGDEPKLLSRSAPVIIAKDRGQGARLAEENNFDLILMDDGYQNNTLHKDISFLVIDGKTRLGNKKLLPAGPLREPLEEGLRRTNAIIILNNDAQTTNLDTGHLPVFTADVKTTFNHKHTEKPSYIAFCGIAHPEKFKRTLMQIGIEPKDFRAFPDHHKFTAKDLEYFYNLIQEKNVRLITTEKDFMRLTAYEDLLPHIDTVPIHLEWQDKEQLISFLKERLAQ